MNKILKIIKNFFIPPKPQFLTRSPKWPKVRREFIKEQGGRCAACGLTTNLEVHHITPFHLKPEWELKKSNLIVLCENQSIFCHYVIGHSFDWKAFNPFVEEDAKLLNKRIKDREYKYKD